jgi:hypothetical protein
MVLNEFMYLTSADLREVATVVIIFSHQQRAERAKMMALYWCVAQTPIQKGRCSQFIWRCSRRHLPFTQTEACTPPIPSSCSPPFALTETAAVSTTQVWPPPPARNQKLEREAQKEEERNS